MFTPKDIQTQLLNAIKNDPFLEDFEKEAFTQEALSFETTPPTPDTRVTRYHDASYYLETFILDTNHVLITDGETIYLTPKQRFLSFRKMDKFMKAYEKQQLKTFDLEDTFVITVDMRNAKTVLKDMDTPFDTFFKETMQETAKALATGIPGVRLVYTGNDEVLLFFKQTSPDQGQPLFHGKEQKLLSLASSIATNTFNKALLQSPTYSDKAFTVQFLAQAIKLAPQTEKTLEYLWWHVNNVSISSVHRFAKLVMPDSRLGNANIQTIMALLDEQGRSWKDEVESHFKYGTLYYSDEASHWQDWQEADPEDLEILQACRTRNSLKETKAFDQLEFKDYE